MDLSQLSSKIISHQGDFVVTHPLITEAADTQFLLTVPKFGGGSSIVNFAYRFQEFYSLSKSRDQGWREDMVQRVARHTMEANNLPPSVPEHFGATDQGRFSLPLVVANLRLEFEMLGSNPSSDYLFFSVTVSGQDEKPHKEGGASLTLFTANAPPMGHKFLVSPLICLMELTKDLDGLFHEDQRTAVVDLAPIARVLGHVSTVYGAIPAMGDPEDVLSDSLLYMLSSNVNGFSVKVSNAQERPDLSWMTLFVEFPPFDNGRAPALARGCSLTFPCRNQAYAIVRVKVVWHSNSFYFDRENGGLRQHNMLAAARMFAEGLANINFNNLCVPPMA